MEEKNQQNKLDTTGQVWKVLDEWPPKNTVPSPSPRKRKSSSKKPKSKEERLESMRRFLFQHEADFQRDLAQKTVKEKEDNKSINRKATPKSALDEREKK